MRDTPVKETEAGSRQTRDLTEEHMTKINDTITQFEREKLIPEQAEKALKVTDSKTTRFYIFFIYLRNLTA